MHNSNEVINAIKKYIDLNSIGNYECINSDLGYQIIISFPHSLMSMDVCDSPYMPYHCFAINGACIDACAPTHTSKELIYFYYDEKETPLDQIMFEIEKAYHFLKEFSVDWFYKRLNRAGNVLQGSIEYVHPDDKSLFLTRKKDEIVSIGTYAQYCLVRSGETQFRVLENGISWND